MLLLNVIPKACYFVALLLFFVPVLYKAVSLLSYPAMGKVGRSGTLAMMESFPHPVLSCFVCRVLG
jgi:hypothetical protein